MNKCNTYITILLNLMHVKNDKKELLNFLIIECKADPYIKNNSNIAAMQLVEEKLDDTLFSAIDTANNNRKAQFFDMESKMLDDLASKISKSSIDNDQVILTAKHNVLGKSSLCNSEKTLTTQDKNICKHLEFRDTLSIKHVDLLGKEKKFTTNPKNIMNS